MAAPAVTATATSRHSEIVSATLLERYAAVVRARLLPTRSACARYGTSPDAPADFTTLLVAYDIALELHHGCERRLELDQSERGPGLDAPVHDADGDETETDREGSRTECSDLAQRGEEAIGMGDDEPGPREREQPGEEAGDPLRPRCHGCMIVARR